MLEAGLLWPREREAVEGQGHIAALPLSQIQREKCVQSNGVNVNTEVARITSLCHSPQDEGEKAGAL